MLLWAVASVGRFQALACMSTHVANLPWLRAPWLHAQSTRRSRADIEAMEASLFAVPPQQAGNVGRFR